MGFVEEDITANSVEIENDIEVYQEVERCSVDLDELPDLSEVEPNTEETKQEVIEEDIGANAVDIENDIETVDQEGGRYPADLDQPCNIPNDNEVEPNSEETKQEELARVIYEKEPSSCDEDAVEIENDIDVGQEGGRCQGNLEKNSNIPNDNENEPTSEETCDDNKVEPTSSEESCILSSAIGKDEAEPGMKVEVAGTWTAIPWLPIPCELSLDGLWEKELKLGKGVYEYKFLVNGAWFLDPSKPTVQQQDGFINNILTVEGTYNSNEVLEDENEVERARSEEIKKCHQDVNEVSGKEICIDTVWSDKIEEGYEDVNKVSGEEIEIDITSVNIDKDEEIEIRKARSDETEKGYEDVLTTSEAIDPEGVREGLSKESIAADTILNAIYEAEGRQEDVRSKLKDKSEQENSLNSEREEKTTNKFCSDLARMVVLNEFAQNDGSLDRQCRSLFAEPILQSSSLFKFLDAKFATNQKDNTVTEEDKEGQDLKVKRDLKEENNLKVESRIEEDNNQGGDQEASPLDKEEDDRNAFENEGSNIKWEWKAL